MRALCDTNVVLRYVNASDADHSRVAHHVDGLTSGGAELCIAAQNLFEFWAVATRPPSANGLGMSAQEARRTIEVIRTSFTLLPDPADLLDRWLDLCTSFAVSGRCAHDARLVACMVGNGVSDLVTLNDRDFARYAEIRCIVPEQE